MIIQLVSKLFGKQTRNLLATTTILTFNCYISIHKNPPLLMNLRTMFAVWNHNSFFSENSIKGILIHYEYLHYTLFFRIIKSFYRKKRICTKNILHEKDTWFEALSHVPLFIQQYSNSIQRYFSSYIINISLKYQLYPISPMEDPDRCVQSGHMLQSACKSVFSNPASL